MQLGKTLAVAVIGLIAYGMQAVLPHMEWHLRAFFSDDRVPLMWFLSDIGHIAWLMVCWCLTTVTIGSILPHGLISSTNASGKPVFGLSEISIFLAGAALTLLALRPSPAVGMIDLLLGVGFIIRFVQWNIFEPNGLKEFAQRGPETGT